MNNFLVTATSSILMILFTNNAAANMSGSIYNNRYISPNGELSVAIPSLPNLPIIDGKNDIMYFVDIVDQKYWMMGGGAYSLEWFNYLQDPRLPTWYGVKGPLLAKKLVQVLPSKMLKMAQNRNMLIASQQCQYVTLPQQGVKAYRCVFRGSENGVPDVFIGSSFAWKGRIINCYAKYRLNQQIPWDDYNAYISSIQLK